MNNRMIAAMIALAGLHALPGSAAPNTAVLAVTACREIGDGAARLACFDKAAAGLGEAIARKDVVVLDREAVRETRRGLFGFTLPRLPFFGNDKADKDSRTKPPRDEIDEIDAVVKSARAVGYDGWRLVLADGAVWLTTEPFRLAEPRPGSKVHIKRAAFGSYMLKLDGDRAVRARREG